jgi:hypothetical protein
MSDVRFFNLSIPAPRRLAMMRADFASHAARFPHCPEYIKPATWRDVRGSTLTKWESYFGMFARGRDGTDPVWYTHQGETFRAETDASGEGFYTDEHCNDVAIGIVARLPHGRFLAGYRWTSNDERVYFADVFDDEHDAARMADEHAQVFAESTRDYEAAEAERIAEEDREEAITDED